VASTFESLWNAQVSQLKIALALTATAIFPDGLTRVSNVPFRIKRADPRFAARPTQSDGEHETAQAYIAIGDMPKPVRGTRFLITDTGEVWTVTNTPITAKGQYYFDVERSSTERVMDRRAKE
jgi:hypothetical protein